MYFERIWWVGVDRIELAHGREKVVASCKRSADLSGSIKFWEFLDWLRYCWLLEKFSASWIWLIC
jgi:hypothetical protein